MNNHLGLRDIPVTLPIAEPDNPEIPETLEP
jgi:hypothetical protein